MIKFWRFEFIPFWKVINWGFQWEQEKYGDKSFKIARGGDEWHNQSFYIIIPLIGELVYFRTLDKSGEPHPWAWQGTEITAGEFRPNCKFCLSDQEFIKTLDDESELEN